MAHWGIFETKVPTTPKNGDPAERNWTTQALLTFAERHTLSTRAHPEPLMPLIGAIPPVEDMPTGLRRAAINHASGKVKGWHTLLKQWEHDGKKGGTPQLGEPNEPVTFYADMVAYPDFDLLPQAKVQHTLVTIKLWSEDQWQLVPLPVILPKTMHEALRAGHAETRRITETRKQIQASKAPNEPWTEADHGAVRPKVWVPLSLTLYMKRDKRYPGHRRFALHVPMEKSIDPPRKPRNNFGKIRVCLSSPWIWGSIG